MSDDPELIELADWMEWFGRRQPEHEPVPLVLARWQADLFSEQQMIEAVTMVRNGGFDGIVIIDRDGTETRP